MSEKIKAAKGAESASEVKITLEEFIKNTKPNPGLVASFKVENASEGFEPRSEEEWTEAFEAQSKKVYK